MTTITTTRMTTAIRMGMTTPISTIMVTITTVTCRVGQ